MSYDFSMEADLGGAKPTRLWNYQMNVTYNLNSMFCEALDLEESTHELRGKTGEELIPLLQIGIRDMEMNPTKYEEMNPPNGWGDEEGALKTLRTLLNWCVQSPKARLVIS